MDPLSALVSVAGLVGLCATVSRRVCAFIGKSEDENRSLHTLKYEVDNLLYVVQSFRDALQEIGSSAPRWQPLTRTIRECHRILEVIDSMFDIKPSAFNEILLLKPDTRAKEMQNLAAEIDKQRQELILSLVMQSLISSEERRISETSPALNMSPTPRPLAITDRLSYENNKDKCNTNPEPSSVIVCSDLLTREQSHECFNENGKSALQDFSYYICMGTESGARGVLRVLSRMDLNTALLLTVHHGNGALVRALLDTGADAEACEKNGQPALIIAAGNGFKDICKSLLDCGANVDRRDRYEETGLMLAAMNGHEQVVKLFLDGKANVRAVNRGGFNAQALARRRGNYLIADLIQSYERKCKVKCISTK